ncbi:MAG: glycosyltransferase, partial [Phormidesmis sp.]
MKIAIISSGFLPVVDGVTVSLFQRVRALSKLGHQVLILCPDYQAVASVYPDWRDYQGEILPGVRVVNLPSEPFMGVEFERNLSGKANRLLNQELAAFEPDIVHVDEPDRIFLGLLKAPGVAYAKQHNIPCVGFYHTNFIDYIEDFLP